ncbi:ParB N-terminal domain-containing protein [Bradyrhizobium genosp. L]|uniref:ParB N-terminal domain-containing protein n=1 Tax=Bradyrhizobium genosp. L TaxID=83637 RepID=UPI0018A269B5|nr:ParB N-terminal domain-containing protein [Bradyrhizobium genosp. L]QPF81639.1 ParB N-terminal domain-containing protein [Bradyrhizobium genosp. L]
MNATPYQVMPALAPDEFEALKADIKARGVQVPVEYDEMGNILDGHHRVQACFDLGITHWPRLVRHGLSEEEKRRHARRLNLDRRHLNAEQKRELIAAELREQPARSDRTIGAGLNVDHKTVGAVRDKLESTGEIPQLTEREGRDNRTRRITQFVPATPEEEKGLLMSARELNFRNDEANRENRRSLQKELSEKSLELTGSRKYAAIYFDAPWKRKQGITDRSYENHYPTMTWDEIVAWAASMRERLLNDAWGFMWIPRAHAFALHPVTYKVDVGGEIVEVDIKTPLAWAIARAMGFDAFSTCFVWTKTDEEHADDAGMGILVRDQDELLLMFKKGRGNAKPARNEVYNSNHRERSRPLGHSRKPQHYREMIASMVGDGVPVLECFARHDEKFPLPGGWDSWGNQAKSANEEAA